MEIHASVMGYSLKYIVQKLQLVQNLAAQVIMRVRQYNSSGLLLQHTLAAYLLLVPIQGANSNQ